MLEAIVGPGQLHVSGGFDNRPVDGDGYSFEIQAVAVPEPQSKLLLIAALVRLLLNRPMRH